MTPQIAILLAILAAALFLFAVEWVSADVVALGVLLTLVLTGLLPVEQAFTGFGSETVIMILGLLIITAALERTGVVELAGRAILDRTGKDSQRVLGVVMITAAVLGAFMSNTASTAFFIPIVIGLARQTRISPSKILMPLAFASILTSSVTLVSTSTNLVVSGMLSRAGMAPMAMFELAPVGIPIAIAGLLYMFLIGRRLIPDRVPPDELTEEFGLRPFLTEVLILPNSPLVGKTLVESGLGQKLDLTVLRVVRSKRKHLAPQADLTLEGGDVLLVEGQRDNILKIKDEAGIDIKADVMLSDPDLETENMRLAEGMVLLHSPLINRTLKGIGFRERYGLQVLAINRAGETIYRKISQIPLRLGDVLLLQGHQDNFRPLERDNILRLLGEVKERRINLPRARIAILTFVVALALTTFEVLTLPVAVMLASVVMFVTRCITPEDAYREVEWKAIILIGSMLAFGHAMELTGTAEYLAGQLANLAGDAHPSWLLAGFFALTVLLTQPMSHQAATVVILPVALQTAGQLDLNPRSFAMMVALAASTSFLTPLEPSCLMVYGLGRYRFMDFLKVGSLLTVIIFLIALVMVPIIWPLGG
jgi:di/tricarboxylate transporter